MLRNFLKDGVLNANSDSVLNASSDSVTLYFLGEISTSVSESSMSKTSMLYPLTSPQSLLGVVVRCSSALQSLRTSEVNEVELGSQSLKVNEPVTCLTKTL